MNLRKLKNQAGFTLVELIVVIAIMAILAGVAVPVYSGYIEKANKAADLQLLGAVNSAFGAACAENGIFEIADREAQISISSEKIDLNSPRAKGTDVSEAFKRYFAGNETAEFKVITALTYKNGAFQDDATLEFTYTDANGNKVTVNVPQSTIDSFNESTWGTKVTSGQLLGLVGDVTDFAGAVDNTTYQQLMNSDAYKEAAAAILGVDDYTAGIQSLANDMLEDWLADNPGADQAAQNAKRAEYAQSIMANTAVLVAAKNAQTSSSGIMDILASGDAKNTIKNTMTSDPTTGLSQAALAYGMYTSYMYSTGKANPADGALDPISVLNSFDPETNSDFANFQTYLDSDQGKQDMEGYLAALNTVGDNSGVASDVVISGFNTSELESLLNQVMGK